MFRSLWPSSGMSEWNNKYIAFHDELYDHDPIGYQPANQYKRKYTTTANNQTDHMKTDRVKQT
jgi:hypothetical protein